MTCQLRNLIFAADLSSKPNYMEKSAKAQGIQFECENGVLAIYLPGLLPKRKVHTNTAFINEPLYYALKNYIEAQPIPIFDSCVVCFIQVYDRRLPLRRIRTMTIWSISKSLIPSPLLSCRMTAAFSAIPTIQQNWGIPIILLSILWRNQSSHHGFAVRKAAFLTYRKSADFFDIFPDIGKKQIFAAKCRLQLCFNTLVFTQVGSLIGIF